MCGCGGTKRDFIDSACVKGRHSMPYLLPLCRPVWWNGVWLVWCLCRTRRRFHTYVLCKWSTSYMYKQTFSYDSINVCIAVVVPALCAGQRSVYLHVSVCVCVCVCVCACALPRAVLVTTWAAISSLQTTHTHTHTSTPIHCTSSLTSFQTHHAPLRQVATLPLWPPSPPLAVGNFPRPNTITTHTNHFIHTSLLKHSLLAGRNGLSYEGLLQLQQQSTAQRERQSQPYTQQSIYPTLGYSGFPCASIRILLLGCLNCRTRQ